jgi:cytochrome b561
MQLSNTTKNYGSLLITLHWVMLALIAGVYACMELRGYFPRGSDTREALKAWHYTLGITVLLLVVFRLTISLTSKTPEIVPRPSIWQTRLALLMKIALYVFMFCMPVAGWLVLSASGEAIPFFGFHLPALISEHKETAEFIEEIHETGGKIGYFLIGLHAFAALFHHYYIKDNTLKRMLGKG